MNLHNPGRRVLASALAVGLVCGSAGTMLIARQAKTGERVDIVITTVKAGKQQQFEDFMTKFGAVVEKAAQKDKSIKEANVRPLYPTKPNEDGTFTYVFLMDPVHPDPNGINIPEILRRVLSAEEVAKLIKYGDDAVAGPQQVLELVQK